MAQINFVVLMVATYNVNGAKFEYIERNFIDGRLPKNTTKDIMYYVSHCNDNPLDDKILYVDMYGYIFNDETIIWEVADTEPQQTIPEINVEHYNHG